MSPSSLLCADVPPLWGPSAPGQLAWDSGLRGPSCCPWEKEALGGSEGSGMDLSEPALGA